LGGVSPKQVAFAVEQAEIRIEQRDNAGVKVRAARLTDIDALEGMVTYWAGLGENLPRTRNELVRDIGSFAVAEQGGEVTGCASLYVYDSGLAEIRSLGVEAGWQGQGQGSAIVSHLVDKAKQMAIKKVFVLTRSPEFFMKQSFIPTSKTLLPEKVLKDCEQCPRQHACDEVALEVNLDEQLIAKMSVA
jgi:argininosuccinate lyase/amino-acid N-acetyltransferase